MCLEPSQSDSRKPVEPNDATEPQHVQARCGHVSCLEAANRLLVQLSNALIAKMEAKDETVSLLESQAFLLTTENALLREEITLQEREARALRERMNACEVKGVEWEKWKRDADEQIQMHCERTMAENEMHKKRVKVMEARIHYLENDLKKVLNRS